MSNIGGGTGGSIARWRHLCAAGQMLCLSGEDVAEQATVSLINAAADYGSLPAPPQVVCLCGSTRYLATFLDWQRILTLHGVIVLTIGYVMKDKDADEETGKILDSLHKRKIDLADVILVLDVDGYIGESLESEIEYAKETKTTVKMLSESHPDYKSPDLESALFTAYATKVGCRFDEDAGCHMGYVDLVRN